MIYITPMFTFEPKDEKVSIAQVKFEEVVFCGALKQTDRTECACLSTLIKNS